MRPPEGWAPARVTIVIAGVTAAAWILTTAVIDLEIAAVWGGFIPSRVNGMAGDHLLAPVWITPLTATLIHAGIIHLLFNMMILLFCGRPVETILGGANLAILYVLGAYAAAAAHYVSSPDDAIPMVGASGAISAVLGAYAMLFGRNRVKIRNSTAALVVNALWLGVAWILLQILAGYTFGILDARLAIAAHIGGFLAGLILARPLLLWRYRGA